MPDRTHPALANEISVSTARRLFPGTPNKVFWWAGRAHGVGVKLSFGTAYHVACAHWEAELKAARSARYSVAGHARWQARRATAAEAALAHLQIVIVAELAALSATA
jgi:hypothetical protein